jgi:proline dehydrogenase
MEILFAEAKRFAIATHDQKLIENALKMLEQTSAEVEFQMLMGIRDDLKPSLVSKDLPLSEYIPYGRTWFSYSIRRLRERKRNILLLFRALFS